MSRHCSPTPNENEKQLSENEQLRSQLLWKHCQQQELFNCRQQGNLQTSKQGDENSRQVIITFRKLLLKNNNTHSHNNNSNSNSNKNGVGRNSLNSSISNKANNTPNSSLNNTKVIVVVRTNTKIPTDLITTDSTKHPSSGKDNIQRVCRSSFRCQVADSSINNDRNVARKSQSPSFFVENNGYKKQVYQILQPRIIKNNIACFYGQTIAISQKLWSFTVQVYGQGSNSTSKNPKFDKLLVSADVSHEKILQLEKRKQVFSISSQLVQFIWETKISSDCQSRFEEPAMDRSIEDIPDQDQLQPQNYQTHYLEQQAMERKIYSPAVKGQLRKQRNSIRFKKFEKDGQKDRRSEQISQSPHKLTMDTNQTVIKFRKRIKILSPENIAQDKSQEKKQENQQNKIKPQTAAKQFGREYIIHKKNHDEVNEQVIQGYQFQEKKIMEKQQKKFIHPIFSQQIQTKVKEGGKSPKKKTKSFNFKNKQPLTPQFRGDREKMQFGQNPCYNGKRKAQKFLEKLSIKSLLYTSMIGIIGGVAAAQF